MFNGDTGETQLIQSHSLANFCFEISETQIFEYFRHKMRTFEINHVQINSFQINRVRSDASWESLPFWEINCLRSFLERNLFKRHNTVVLVVY